MKHNLKGEQLKRKRIAITVIKGHLQKGNIKKAVEIAENNGITPQEFGAIEF